MRYSIDFEHNEKTWQKTFGPSFEDCISQVADFLEEHNMDSSSITCAIETEKDITVLSDVLEALGELEAVSSCCGMPFYSETDICTGCGEHG